MTAECRPSRRNLVIVRAGDTSLHPGWLAGPEDRNWDLIVNYFGSDPLRYRVPGVVRIDSVGPKWPLLQKLLIEHSELLEQYERIWFPDDDLEMAKAQMNRFFDICATHALELAQPSLSADSPLTHALLVHNRASALRYSNFVEVMAPCFSAACLRRALPTFSGTLSGWGIDWIWPRLATDQAHGIAVVDEVVIRHTRELGGPNYDVLRAQGRSPLDELLQFEEQNALHNPRLEFHEVIWRGSHTPRAPSSILARARLLLGYLHALPVTPDRRKLLRQALGRFRRPLQDVA